MFVYFPRYRDGVSIVFVFASGYVRYRYVYVWFDIVLEVCYAISTL